MGQKTIQSHLSQLPNPFPLPAVVDCAESTKQLPSGFVSRPVGLLDVISGYPILNLSVQKHTCISYTRSCVRSYFHRCHENPFFSVITTSGADGE